MKNIIATLLLFVIFSCGSEQQEAEYSTYEGELTTAQKSVILNRSKQTIGYSYWWGHARFGNSGTSDFGSCIGVGSNSTHNGRFGADCSGMVAKVWEVPSNNKLTSPDNHPFSTADFNVDGTYWKKVDRKTIDKADGLVYRSGSSGHVVIYESTDPWGHYRVYECKGCAEGCVVNTRPFSSAYKAIRKR